MEVMGLMLGEFVDEYTVRVIDVFAMPQSGNRLTFKSFSYKLIPSSQGFGWMRINLSCWIRIWIQEGENDPQKI
jgi:hypothetical protein